MADIIEKLKSVRKKADTLMFVFDIPDVAPDQLTTRLRAAIREASEGIMKRIIATCEDAATRIAELEAEVARLRRL